MNDIDEYLTKRYTTIKNKAELELETIEAHGIINPETLRAKADAETKLKLTTYLLRIKENTR
jgi:hypothetical protein